MADSEGDGELPRAGRRGRHWVPDDDDQTDVESASSVDYDAADDEPRGRHGGSKTGLSAAELIARSRAALVTVAQLDTPVPNEPESVEATPEQTSRSGRNLPVALGIGVALGAIIISTLVFYRPSFAILVSIAAAIGIYEMVMAISTVEARPPLLPLLVGGAALDAAAWFRGADGLVGALLLTVLGLIVWRLGDGAAGYFHDVAAGTLIALYVPFLAGFAVLLAHPDDGAARVVIFIVAVVCSDTGGFITGVLFGKHPMAPTVSPKKSWEGFAGSVLACSLCGVVIMTLTFHHAWWQGALYGLTIAITATLGDLGESMIKRDLGLKDMGKLLPGHGGMMDRLDSLLPCAPVAYLLISVFVPT